MNKKQIKLTLRINCLLLERFGLPSRKKSLPDPLDLLIATILSQNTNDRNSYKAYRNLIAKFNTWEEALKAPVEKIENEIRVAGLGRQKSLAIKNLLQQLFELRDDLDLSYLDLLTDEEVIEDLTGHRGIGVKTASCVLLFSFDRNVCPVDTHLHRTLNRIGLFNTTSPEKTYYALNKNFPPDIAHSFHTNLIRLGREICKPKYPDCSHCPLKRLCKYPDKPVKSGTSAKAIEFMLLDNITR